MKKMHSFMHKTILRGKRAVVCAFVFAVFPVNFVNANETEDFRRMVSFGDSLSDGGRYIALVPPGAGKYTINPDPVWVEMVANGLSLPSSSVASGGLNFAEGGARVFVPQPPSVFSELNIRAQVEGFLAGGGSFNPDDVVTIEGGGNDLLALLAGEATLADVADAAVEVARLTDLIVAQGAGLVIVTNLGPEIFNGTFESRLAANGTNALFINFHLLNAEIMSNPSAFGFTNITDPACTKVSFVCLPEDLVAPDANKTYLLADTLHQSGAGQAIRGEIALAALRAPSQIGQLGLVGESQLLSVHDRIGQQYYEPDDQGALRVFGGAGYDHFEIDALRRHPGVGQDSFRFTIGLDKQFSDTGGIGAVLDYFKGNGDFNGDSGGYDSTAVIGTIYYRGASGRFGWGAQANLGWHQFENIIRRVRLGPLLREHQGDTGGKSWGLSGEASYDVITGNNWKAGPVMGLRYMNVSLDGYAEQDTTSTSMTFSDQDDEVFQGIIGLAITAPEIAWIKLKPFARMAYIINIKEQDRRITITPEAAPISLTADAYTPDNSYLTYSIGVAADVR